MRILWLLVSVILIAALPANAVAREADVVAERSNAVARSVPSAFISSPYDFYTTFLTTDRIIFSGAGDDAKDGILVDSSLVWTSNIDGVIGSGEAFNTSLSAGIHIIKLTVTDDDGASVDATRALTVKLPSETGGGVRVEPKPAATPVSQPAPTPAGGSFGYGGGGAGGGGGLGPTPTPNYSTSANIVDDLVKYLEPGNIVFNVPGEMKVGQRVDIELLLSSQVSIPELTDAIREEVGSEEAEIQIEGAEIQISNRMKAKLTGTGFEVVDLTTEIQAISNLKVTRWAWEIEAVKPGNRKLNLSVWAVLTIADEPTDFELKTFEKDILITVSWNQKLQDFGSNNWQWLWTFIFVPIGAWVFSQRTKRA